MNNPQQNITGRRAVVLIVTLSFVALLTIVIVAFFSRSQSNRQIAFSATSQQKAEVLAHSAIDVIVGEIRDEITLPAANSDITTASGVTTYLPKTTADAMPEKVGVSSPTGPIIKVSASGVGVRPGSLIQGSSVTIDTPGFNYSGISSSRWFTSQQLSPALGWQATLPTWLMVTHGGIALPTPADAANPSKSDYVVGRFAYTVYDVGSLLDANLAGHPTASPFASSSTDVGFKSSAACADLTALGATTNDIDTFVSWRNAATGTNAATYSVWASGLDSSCTSALALNAAMAGHTVISAGDNGVVSRRDLIRNPDIPSALKGNLTHFSRTQNAPSLVPAAVTNANPAVIKIRFASDTTVTHYRDDGTKTTYAVKAGDPLVQHRFSLAKLAWLRYDGPNPTAFNSTLSPLARTQAIRDCFGLEWVTDHWNYVSASNNAIKNLGDLVNGSLEPNFFECLKAGIVEGSLGRTWDGECMALACQKNIESNKDIQIMQIGANIIDCADTDNYPTTFTFNYGGIDVPVYGVEDLPMLVGSFASLFGKETEGPILTTGTYDTLQWGDIAMAPILFNPHRPGNTPTAGPSHIQVRFTQGIIDNLWTYTNTELALNAGKPLSRNSSPLAFASTALCTPIVVPSSNYENFRKDRTKPGFKPIVDADASTATKLTDRDPAHAAEFPAYQNNKKVHSFIIYQFPNGLKYSPFTAALYMNLGATQMVLEYQDASRNWHAYSTLAGNQGFTTSGIGGMSNNTTSINVTGNSVFQKLVSGSSRVTCGEYAMPLMKIDPRTTRLGIGQCWGFYVDNRSPLPDSTTRSPNGMKIHPPFDNITGNISNGGVGLYPGKWVEGNKTAPDFTTAAGFVNSTNVADPDTIQRPADAWLDPANANLYRKYDDDSNRPVILQRPFRSVGELGYVFRDSPWKTLNFFDGTSGDAGLLDFFSITDEPSIGAGRSNLCTTQTAVTQALLAGAAQSADGTSPISQPGALASQINSFPYSSGVPNPASLASILAAVPLNGTTALDGIKYRRESVVRSLSNTTQTRTWNLLIDVVAQSGRYPGKASKLENFIVEGEKRFWLSIAIDRYTGKILDQQLEPAND